MLLLASRGCCNMSPFQQQQQQKCLSSAIFVLSAFPARCCWDSGTQIRKVVIFQFSIYNSIFFPNHLFQAEPKLDSAELSGFCRGCETAQTCLKCRDLHADWIWVNWTLDAGNDPNTSICSCSDGEKKTD